MWLVLQFCIPNVFYYMKLGFRADVLHSLVSQTHNNQCDIHTRSMAKTQAFTINKNFLVRNCELSRPNVRFHSLISFAAHFF